MLSHTHNKSFFPHLQNFTKRANLSVCDLKLEAHVEYFDPDLVWSLLCVFFFQQVQSMLWVCYIIAAFQWKVLQMSPWYYDLQTCLPRPRYSVKFYGNCHACSKDMCGWGSVSEKTLPGRHCECLSMYTCPILLPFHSKWLFIMAGTDLTASTYLLHSAAFTGTAQGKLCPRFRW